MGKYTIISDCTPEQYKAIDNICDRFMTIDTVGHEESRAWQEKNHDCLIVVTNKENEALGYLELLPLFQEVGAKLHSGEYGETDIYPEHILDKESTPFASCAYMAAIAVDKPDSFSGGCCALSLMAACTKQLLTLYNKKYLKYLFINPTTEPGYALANKLGFKSTTPKVRSLRSSHMYVMEMSDENWKLIENIHQRFHHLINYNLKETI